MSLPIPKGVGGDISNDNLPSMIWAYGEQPFENKHTQSYIF